MSSKMAQDDIQTTSSLVVHSFIVNPEISAWRAPHNVCVNVHEYDVCNAPNMCRHTCISALFQLYIYIYAYIHTYAPVKASNSAGSSAIESTKHKKVGKIPPTKNVGFQGCNEEGPRTKH